MSAVFMVRHGQVNSNQLRRYAGGSDESLNPAGERQAVDVAERLADLGIAAVWTSEVMRARETAAIIVERLRVPLVPDARLNEMIMGPWEGLTEDEIAARYSDDWSLWNRRPDMVRLPHRETLAELQARVMPVVTDAAAAPAPVLLVTHVAPIRVATLAVLGAPLRRYKRVSIPNTACVILRPGEREVIRLGTMESLRQELAAVGAGEAA